MSYESEQLAPDHISLNFTHSKFDMAMEVLAMIPCYPHFVFVDGIAKDLLGSNAYDEIKDVLVLVSDLKLMGFDIKVPREVVKSDGEKTSQRSLQITEKGCKQANEAAASYLDAVYTENKGA